MKIPFQKNTITNYIVMFIGLLQGILVTRWLVSELGQEHYGLWGMLWSFFCYSLLLDFGMGVAAQKATATEMWRKDITLYNRTLSTVVFINLLMSFVILAGTIIAMIYVRSLFHLEEKPGVDLWYYRQALLYCGLGSAVVFPLGVFTEILVGLQKIYIRNYVVLVFKILELIFVLVIFAAGGGLITLLAATLIQMFLRQIVYFIFVKLSIPGFRLGIFPDRAIFKEIFHFSGAAYIVSVARIIWERGTNLMISLAGGLNLVSEYNLGVNLPVKILTLASPYQENVSPICALLYARGRYKLLGKILLSSMKWNSFLATGIVSFVILFSDVILHFLFKVDAASITYICRISTLSVFCWLVLYFVPTKYLLMANQHKLLSIITMTESISFVIATVIIFFICDLDRAYVVMYTSIGSRLFSILFLVLPRFISSSKLTVTALIKTALITPFFLALPTIIAGMAIRHFLYNRIHEAFFLIIAGLVCVPVYLLSFYLFGLNSSEKKRYKSKVTAFLAACS